MLDMKEACERCSAGLEAAGCAAICSIHEAPGDDGHDRPGWADEGTGAPLAHRPAAVRTD